MSKPPKPPRLKACPFCGGPAGYERPGGSWAGDGRLWAAGCKQGHAQSPDMKTARDAAEWWNCRKRSLRVVSAN